MKSSGTVLAAVCVALTVVAGCSRSEPVPVAVTGRSSEDSDVVASTPAPPESAVALMIEKTRADLKKKSYEDAVKKVIAMAEIRTLSPEQVVDLKNAILNVKLQLAEAATAGDSNAVAAIAYFKSRSPAGR